MSSSHAPKWRRFLHKTPLFKKCPDGNYHWFFDKHCFCRVNEHCGDWHGGIYDFKTKQECKLKVS